MHFNDFKFDGLYLSDYGFTMGFFGGKSSDSMFSGGELTFNNFKLPSNDRQHFAGSAYETPLSLEFDIFKKDELISITEYAEISRWLQRPDGYHWLQFTASCGEQNDTNDEDIYFNCMINCTPIDGYDGFDGIHLSIVTDSPYAYSSVTKKKFSFNGTNRMEFNDVSDRIGLLYPETTITVKQAGNLKIVNTTMNPKEEVAIENVKVNDVIKFGRDRTSISGILDPNKFNFIFPCIGNTFESRKNIITCNLKADIEISYRLSRMVRI